MAKINPNLPRAPQWPWGGPRSVREKLVDPAQLDRKKAKKKGDPKNPALASAALLDFIGPAHSAEELRLPLPPFPEGHDADTHALQDGPQLSSVAERGGDESRKQLDRALTALRAPADRVERLKALLAREAQMLSLVGRISEEIKEIDRRRREEQREEGF
jgi:hypothetical protein